MLIPFRDAGSPGTARTVLSVIVASVLVAGCASDRVRHEAATELRRAEAAYNRQDFGTAAKLLSPLALRGDTEAQYALGYLHYYGRGVPRDRARAVRWFQDASQRGHRKARQALDLLLEQTQMAQVPPTAEQMVAEEMRNRAAAATASTVVPLAPANRAIVTAAPAREAPPVLAPRPLSVAFVDANTARMAPLPSNNRRVVESATPAAQVRRQRSRYTLQLLGSRSKRDLAALVTENGLDPTQAYYLRGVHKGGPWYRLLYGGYRSPAAARAALGLLPKAVKSSRPWVRPMPAVAAAALQR